MERALLLLLFACSADKGGVDTAGTVSQAVIDADSDGYTVDADCNDADSATHPGAAERCDGTDNDCDGQIDEDVLDVFYLDADADGYGSAGDTIEACEAPAGAVTNGTDCDDSDPGAYPSAPEVCDGVDNDCDGETDDGVTLTFYTDADSDGYGSADAPVEACAEVSGLTEDATDCDDADASVYPDAAETCDGIDNDCDTETDEEVEDTFYVDLDGDGFGDSGDTATACAAPSGYTAEPDDCDDTNPDVHPGADEDDCTDPTDYNCEGWGGGADADGDGWAACEDCDDTSSGVSPSSPERCDDRDNDCDGDTDEDAVDASTWYIDTDGDGWGVDTYTLTDCEQPTGYVADTGDCDDSSADASPDGAEVCDGLDNDCDGTTDGADAADVTEWYIDADGDGWGSADTSESACDAPSGYTDNDDDCDDTSADAAPGGLEVCDGLDNDCDGAADGADALDAVTWYGDSDGDGFGDEDDAADGCDAPSGYVASDEDCDDTNADSSPNGVEVCDGIDNDCSGDVDEDSAVDAATWYIDHDGDGYGSADFTAVACDAPTGYIADSTDCDDLNADAYPGGTEICDGADNDCDGTTDGADAVDLSAWYIDADEDGWGSADTSELACEAPSGYVETSDDCDDTDSDVNPDAAEVCDDADNDCDGTTDGADAIDVSTWYSDGDGDGYGDSVDMATACDAPSEYVDDDTDCDDTDAAVNPAATETCDGADEDCDGDTDEGLYGLGADCAAADCADVLAVDSSAGDGEYWVDPDGVGALEVWCDMSASDGPWAYPVYDDLVAYWSFDGADVTTADVGSYSGTAVGGASSSGVVPYTDFGSSLYADNNDSSYVELSSGVTLGAQHTVVFWANNDSCSNNQIPILFDDDCSFLGDLYHAGAVYRCGAYTFHTNDSGCSGFQNTWRHFAYVDDGSSIRAWSDGGELSPSTYSYAGMGGYTIDRFMNRPGFGTNGLSGYMDDLAVFSRALSEEEIEAMYDLAVERGLPFRW